MIISQHLHNKAPLIFKPVFYSWGHLIIIIRNVTLIILEKAVILMTHEYFTCNQKQSSFLQQRFIFVFPSWRTWALLTSGAPAIFSCSVPFLSLSSLFEYWMVCTWLKSARCVGFGKKRQTLWTTDARLMWTILCSPHGPKPTSSSWGHLPRRDVWGNQLSMLPGGPFSLWGAVMDLLGPPAHFTVRDVSALCAPDGRGALHPQELHKWSPVPHDTWQRKEEGSPRPDSPSGLGGTVWNSWPKGTFCSTSHRERDLFPLPMHPELEQVSETFWSSTV